MKPVQPKPVPVPNAAGYPTKAPARPAGTKQVRGGGAAVRGKAFHEVTAK